MIEPKTNPRDNGEQSSTGSFRFEKQILNTSSIGVMITRVSDGTILYANKAVGDLLGIASVDSIIGQPVPDFYWDSADRQKLLELFRNEGSVTSNETRARRANGNMIWVSISLQPFQFEGEQSLLAEIVDNTDRKRVEDAVKASQQKLSLLIDSSPLAVIEWNTNFEVVSWNPAAERIFGYSFEEARGRHAAGLIVPAEYKAAVDDVWANLLKQTGGTRSTNGNVTKDGRAITCEWYNTPLAGSDGTVFGVSSLVEDVTEKKKSEEKALQLQSAVEQTGDGIALADLNGNVIYANPAWAEIHGYTVDDIQGKHLSIFHTQEQLEQEVIPFNNKVMEIGRYSSEIGHARKDGSTFPTLMTTVVQKDENGNPIGLIGTIRDITSQKQRETSLQNHSQTLSELAKSKNIYSGDLEAALSEITKASASALGIKRSSVWLYNTFHDKIECKDLYVDNEGHSSGIELKNGDYPAYFEALKQERIIAADDAHTNPQTREFSKNYLTPLGITSMLDAPIQFGGVMVGVICNEHVGQKHTWTLEEQSFATSTADFISSAMQAKQRRELESEIQQAFERRGYQVQVSTEISQEVASTTDLDDLFSRVVTLTKERLGYYHTQLLRYDANQDAVVLINGYGETGQKMLAGGHQMPMGQGLIGTAAATGETVLRPTLTDDPDWRPNPLLPDTQGEIAVPIKWQNTVLGVLDVQSDQAGALSDEDRLLFEGLCGQIAIAMHNAELVETVRQNEAKLAEALRTARIANWEYDVEKDLFIFNDEFYSIFHTTVEKAGGYQISSARYAELFVHPDDMELVGTEIGKALSSKERVYNTTLDHRIRYEDGGIGYITVKVTVERDETGKITRYYGANQEITERKQAEEALRVNEARLAEALKTARLANWEYDVEKDIFTFNDQFYSIFHTTVEKAGGYQLSSARYTELFVHPDDLEVVGTEIGKALSSTERVYNTTIDHRIVYEDGGIGYITVQLTVERDENGKITRYYGANQDITERKQTEEALRRSEQEMAERLEEINRLYQTMSREGWKTYRENEELPAGFVFDRTGTRPVEDELPADAQFANIPMRVLGGEVIGTLAVENDPNQPTSPEDYAFFQQVSDQIALALEGARLSAQTQTALAQSEILFEASRRLAQASNLQELLKAAIETFNIPVINGAELNMFNYDLEGDLESLAVVANWWNGTGKEPGAIGSRYSKAMFSAVKLFLTSTPVFISDTSNNETMDASMQRIVKAFNIHAVTFLPLFVGTHQIGVLVMHAEEPHSFTEEETRLFAGLAPQIATVLDNRRQFERAQQQAERESMLNVISQKIQSATTVEAVLQIAARELGHALGAPMTVAQLSMKDKQ
jgi:PAS domain S-box-containing protein